MRRHLTMAVAALALAAWPALATSADHDRVGGHASGGRGYSGGGWHSANGGHVSGGGHAVSRGSYGRGYVSRGYGHERSYGGGSAYRGRGYGHGYRDGHSYGYGRGFRYGYGYGPSWGLGLGWPYYGADYYDVAPYDPRYSYGDGGYSVGGDAYHGNPGAYSEGGDAYHGNPGGSDAYAGNPGAYSGGSDAYDGSLGAYSGRRGPDNQQPSGGGLLRIAVRPLDATIYVDGRFRGSGHEVSTLPLSEGHHRVEVVRPGFRTYTRDLNVNVDQPVQLSISLQRP